MIFCKKYIKNTDIIICCDGGIGHTRALELTPDYILGDFDSCKKKIYNIIKFEYSYQNSSNT